MKRVFVNTRWADNDPFKTEQNLLNTARFCSYIVAQGNSPYAPYLVLSRAIGEDSRQQMLSLAERWLESAQEIWTLSWWIPATDLPDEMRYLQHRAKDFGVGHRSFIINRFDEFSETTLGPIPGVEKTNIIGKG